MKKIIEKTVVTEKIKKNLEDLIAENAFFNGKLKDNVDLYKEVKITKEIVWYDLDSKECKDD